MISNLNAWIQLNLRASLIKGKLKNVTVLSKATVNSDDLSGTGKNLPKVRPYLRTRAFILRFSVKYKYSMRITTQKGYNEDTT